MRQMLVAMVLLLGLAACSSSSSSSGTTADGGRADGSADGSADARCQFPLPINTPPAAMSCPSECPPVGGDQVDDSKQCVRAVLVGCLLCPNGCGGAPEGPCYRNTTDGRIVRVPTYAVDLHPSEWVRCSAAEEQPLLTLPRCN